MSVLLEFSLEADQFSLGTVLDAVDDVRYELERIVPTGTELMPFVWVRPTGDVADTLSRYGAAVRGSENVHELDALDRLADEALYRIEWAEHEDALLQALAETETTVLEARGEDRWTFRVRFADHDALADFSDRLDEESIRITIERTHGFGGETARSRDFGLTQEQREALVLAVRRGYFATPSETSLEALADELDISKQAVSNRIRRGNRKVLGELLLPNATDE